jgi:hypothetical protein
MPPATATSLAQVARLAKALPSQRGDLKAMAAYLREVMGDADDGDATATGGAGGSEGAAEDLDLT